jgi:sugar phosphate isomerase/epimerase
LPKVCLGQDGFVVENRRTQSSRDAILAFARYHNFEGIEIHADFEIYASGTGQLMKKHYSKFSLQIPGLQTAHITSLYSPISDDVEERKQYVGAIGEALKFAAELGARHSTLTPPAFSPSYTQDGYGRIVERYIQTISEVVGLAEGFGVVMAIEPEPDLILNGGTYRDSIDDIKLVLNSISSKNLSVLYDIAHVNIISHGDPIGFLKQLNGRVSWVHVADNDLTFTPQGTAKHLEFGHGNVPMESLMRSLKEECPNLGWLQIDTWENPNPYHAAASGKRQLDFILGSIHWT